MEDQVANIENLETIFRKDHKCNSLLYRNVKTPIKQTNTLQDVLKIVSLQVKAIQMADRGNNGNYLSNPRKSNVTYEKAAYDKAVIKKIAGNKFETQCVSDTQLIDVVKVAEAFEANARVTRDMDVSFTVSDLEKQLEETCTKSLNICNNEKVEDGDQAFANNNSKTIPDNATGLENTIIGFTEDFTEDNKIHSNKMNENETDTAIINKDTDKTENIVEIETTIVGFTEDFVESDKDVFEVNDYACNDDDFDALERDRHLSLSPILNKIDPIKTRSASSLSRERSLSPVLGAKTIKKSPSPLIFNLDSFEKFEQVAVPLVEEICDLKTVKHLINSQILDKELFLPSKTSKGIASHTNPLQNVNIPLYMSPNYENLDDGKTSVTDSGHFKLKDDREKHSSTLEDEILFSSDEEVYEHKEIQDLPLTCALETSFYEQPEILDQTMYVGFQTASNKPIEVLTESFTKAKSILDNINTSGKKELPLSELVNIYDSLTKTERDKAKVNQQESLNNTEKDASFDIPDISISTLNKLTGIVTNECVEDKSAIITDLKEGKNSIIENNTQRPYMDMTMLNTDIGYVTKEGNNNLIAQEKYEELSESVFKLKSHNDNQGFKTASNKIIKLSNAALATCQKVFQNINLDENFDINYHKDATCKEATTNRRPEEHAKHLKIDSNNISADEIQTHINDDIILQEFENIEMSIDEKVIHKKPFEGFKTASNKNVRISNKALDKAKHIFDDIKLDLDDNDHLKPKSGLTMETNNKDGYSKDAMNTLESKSKDMIGFKTASNKNIKISDQAIAKTKNLLNDIALDDLVHTSEDTQDISKEIKLNKLNINDFGKACTSTGFQTASNKKIVISNEALVKTKNIFKDIDKHNDINVSSNKSSLNVIGHVSVKALERNERILEETKMQLENKVLADIQGNAIIITNSGFQTASNKPVNISPEAMKRSKNIFQDEIFESRNKYISKQKTTTPNISFQTANNKSVHIPKRALERTKKIFHNLDNLEFKYKLDKISENKPPFSFQTASNKEVKISEEALAKTKRIFNDIDMNHVIDECKLPNFGSSSSKNTFKGFQTASKKDVKISKEALDKVKNIFKDIDYSNDFDDQNDTKRSTFGKKISENVSMSRFRTANNEPVLIPLESLSRSKRLFNDIDDIHNSAEHENDKKYNPGIKEIYPITYESKKLIYEVGSGFTGFKTASNKKVNISEEALAKSKHMLQDIDVSDAKEKTDNKNCISTPLANTDFEKDAKRFKPNNTTIDENVAIVKDVSDSINKENIADIINTQVLNNFEDTLYTEDFREEVPSRNKRSGSPILSCPSAKRRRFKMPFKANPVEPCAKIIQNSVICNESTIFTENYKKNKSYKLRDLVSLDNNNSIDAYLTNFDFDTLLNFEFEGKRNDVNAHKINIESLKETFLSSIKKKLVPNGWLDNHMKLILWKLISYEVKFPKLGVVCTARNVLNQLKYRYDKELYNAERPALRKILEKDDVPSKTLVLCVVSILMDGIKVDNSAATSAVNIELVLTDGWYCVTACIDKMLLRLVRDNKIVVGSKLATNGAELLNCEQGVAPWEDTTSVRLKIFGNSTRRARWDARLGYHGNGAMLSQLSNVKLDGGKVSKLRLFVARVYPALYVEKFEDGSTVTRSERLEHLHQIKYEADRQNILEKLYEEVEKEFSDQESQDLQSSWDKGRPTLQSGSQIFEAIKTYKDSSDFRNHLTSSQTKLLEAHNNKRREQLLEKVHAKLMDKIDKSGLRQGRNVVTVLKIRVVGLEEKNGVVVTRGLLSVWKPNDALLDLIKEDSWIEVMNVVPTAMRYSEIQISAGRQSVFKQSKFKESDSMVTHIKSLKRKCYTIKELNIPQTTDYNEVDTAGIIFLIDPSVQKFDSKSQFQNVYLADKDLNMICVNFWGGLQKFGFQNVLDTGQMVACINLQKRAGNTRNVPQYRATEFTYFTKTPKNRQAKEIVDDLNKISVLDRRRICDECVKLKNNFPMKNNESITPYKMNIELGNNKAVMDSVEKIAHAELNLTGLDFESTFRQNDEELSPKTLKRKREVNNRIHKLKMYGEPPPLSPIHIINKSKNAFNSYKSPLVSNDVSSGVASGINIDIGRNVENQITAVTKQNNTNIAICKFDRNVENNESPVTSLNKTYIKSSVNPVKLNFDNNASDMVDHFAEEFDPSPPLSLD
ncbi:breast cancer type 2 susceptibility protein [Manduca sexta]|uniref:Tower domain-containing protein n=1 Tax=Manduca sexta TaxID=7130 RepID=A0A921ZDA3_MANSE|nr:breast cancer type 2 susceptibility protein [Manduca sexta]KAG6454682.1 hypothetical protein O3G_MSEX008802 [Manduca sexta]